MESQPQEQANRVDSSSTLDQTEVPSSSDPVDSQAKSAGSDDNKESQESEGPGKASVLTRIRAFWREMFLALVSPDRPTRRMALVFFSSLLCLILVSTFGLVYLRQVRARRAEEQRRIAMERARLARLSDYHLAELKLKERTLQLGRFLVELKKPRGAEANVEFIIRCSAKEVREYIETRSVQARSEVMTVLVGAKKEDFLTSAGKAQLRKKILHQLNQWLAREYPGARVEELYFSDLWIE